MRFVNINAELVSKQSYKDILDVVEHGIRVCYKSESNITEGSAEHMVRAMIKSGHCSTLEHGSLTFKIICDRATSHQIERSRTFSYNEMSQRYCDFSKDKFEGVSFLIPESMPLNATDRFKEMCTDAEFSYYELLKLGLKPEVARSVLPNCTATEVYMTGNIRNWRHFLSLRLDTHAQADIRNLAHQILDIFHCKYPVFVEDLWAEYGNKK